MTDTNEFIKLTIATPNKCLLKVTDVTEICFYGGFGLIDILPGHAPLLTSLGTGVVVYTQSIISGFFKISGGIAEVTENSVTLLVDVGEDAGDIDLERAKRALERAESRLAAKELATIDVKRAEAAREKALARIEAVELYKKKGK